MTDQNFKDWKELYQWCADGKTIMYSGDKYDAGENGEYDFAFIYPLDCYTKPLPPKKEWFQVIFKFRTKDYGVLSEYLFNSKEHFFQWSGAKESDYEWIKLIKVEI